MVYAFIIQNLNFKDCEIFYDRVFCSYDGLQSLQSSSKVGRVKDPDAVLSGSSSDVDSLKSYSRSSKLFETSAEKKEFLQYIASRVQMQYCLKVKHSLVPVRDRESFIKGIFMERQWKGGSGNSIMVPVVWQGVPGVGFSLVCKVTENYLQAQKILELIVNQLEKHLQFVSSPTIPLTLIETVALIVNQYLPGGQILFMNSKLTRSFEKQLEIDLFAK